MAPKKTKFKITAAPIESFTARDIYAMKFPDAAKTIARMDTMRKAYISSEAQSVIDSLYEFANRFGNEDYEACDQPSIAQFRATLGKIKHWEIIMFWLYEIDILMSDHELAKLAAQAEQDLKDAEEPQRLSKQRSHSADIMNQAAMLTAMFSGK